MFENRRITTKTAESFRKSFGKEGEGAYVDGVMLYNRLMNEGCDGPLTQALGEQLDRMDKLVATERATQEMFAAALQSLYAKEQQIADFT